VTQPWSGAARAADSSAPKLNQMIHDLAAIGGGAEGSVSRLCFTPLERAAHELVGGWLEHAGWVVRRDPFGNTIADRSGQLDLPPIALGSHADSVPLGGRFDGAAGVIMASRLAQILADADVATRHPLRIVVFAAEEGARFGEPCLGSKAITGALKPEDAERLRDVDGVTLASAMGALGFDAAEVSAAEWPDGEVTLFLEPHVEQGRVLEASQTDVGVVDGVTGSSRLRLTLTGRSDHSGGTPMALRLDALAAAAEVITLVERLGRRYRRGTAATVGRLSVHPNVITTVPGLVELFIDIRDIDELHRQESVRLAREGIERICAARGVASNLEVIAHTVPAHLWSWGRQLLREACEAVGASWRVLSSGAGHDAQVMARRFPSAMLFVPSKGGASHVPREWTEPQQLAIGLKVLLNAVERADKVN
jgi:allantoate deiminase